MVSAWELVSFKIQKAYGEVIYPFGKNARGAIIYTDSGRFSAQVMSLNRVKFASRDYMKGTAEEIKSNYEGYVSYYRSYEFDNENGIITHHVEGSMFPNWEGQALKRFLNCSIS